MAIDSYNSTSVNTEGNKPTFSAVINDFNTFAATATDFFAIQNPVGSGKVIRITEVRMNGGATASVLQDMYGYIRTALNTLGTSAAVSIAKHDQNDVAPVALALNYTANPTLNGVATIIRGETFLAPAFAIPTPAPTSIVWPFGVRPSRCPVIRAGQQFSVSNNGNAVPAGLKVYTTIEWTEENA